ncbi:MAG TPA: long-chain fatty acid--CoA ligase, partial [Mycobacterium sp.]
MAAHPLTRRIADVLNLAPGADAIEYNGRWCSWGQVGNAAHHIAAVTAEYSDNPQIGMLLRHRPPHVAAFLGVLLGGATVVTINPSR